MWQVLIDLIGRPPVKCEALLFISILTIAILWTRKRL